jgi:K+-sensing histidine kinase KdpD
VKRRKTTAEKYAVAIIVVAIAFAVRYGLYGTLSNRIPFGFFTFATLIAAWYGGLGPGLLAAVAGLALADYFFLPPHSADGGIGEAERTAIGIYAITNTMIVVLFWNLHTRLRDLQDELRRREGSKEATRSADPATHPGTPGEVRPL